MIAKREQEKADEIVRRDNNKSDLKNEVDYNTKIIVGVSARNPQVLGFLGAPPYGAEGFGGAARKGRGRGVAAPWDAGGSGGL